jgi:hypothetical protein
MVNFLLFYLNYFKLFYFEKDFFNILKKDVITYYWNAAFSKNLCEQNLLISIFLNKVPNQKGVDELKYHQLICTCIDNNKKDVLSNSNTQLIESNVEITISDKNIKKLNDFCSEEDIGKFIFQSENLNLLSKKDLFKIIELRKITIKNENPKKNYLINEILIEQNYSNLKNKNSNNNLNKNNSNKRKISQLKEKFSLKELSKKNKNSLITICRKEKISGYSHKKKNEIIDLIMKKNQETFLEEENFKNKIFEESYLQNLDTLMLKKIFEKKEIEVDCNKLSKNELINEILNDQIISNLKIPQNINNDTSSLSPSINQISTISILSPTDHILLTPVSKSVSSPPISNSTPVSNSILLTPISKSLSSPPISKSVSSPPISNSTSLTPVSNSILSPPVLNSISSPPVSNSILLTPISKSVSSPPVSNSTLLTPISK